MYSEDKSISNSFEYTINKRSHDLVKFLVLHLLNDKIEDVQSRTSYHSGSGKFAGNFRRKLFPSQGDLFCIRQSWYE